MSRRYLLRTASITVLPYSRAVTAADLVLAARRLKALDDSDVPALEVARIRQHAVLYAIPRWWRERNRIRSPPWPHHSLIETWIALGASRALDRKDPDDGVQVVPAYVVGYVTVTTAYKQG